MTVAVQIYSESLNHEYGLPQYETAGAAGMDVRANERVVIGPNETKLVKTGLYVAVPPMYEIQVRPRSGLSLKTPLRIANAPGTVDCDYRGEVGIIVHNTHQTDEFVVEIGERIAQLVLQQVPQIKWEVVQSKEELGSTVRGEGGFGSSGTK